MLWQFLFRALQQPKDTNYIVSLLAKHCSCMLQLSVLQQTSSSSCGTSDSLSLSLSSRLSRAAALPGLIDNVFNLLSSVQTPYDLYNRSDELFLPLPKLILRDLCPAFQPANLLNFLRAVRILCHLSLNLSKVMQSPLPAPSGNCRQLYFFYKVDKLCHLSMSFFRRGYR